MAETYTPDNLFGGAVAPKIMSKMTILTGQGVLARGTALGRVLLALGAVVPGAGNTGNGAVADPALGKNAKIGNYVATCITAAANGGTFSVIDPDGIRLADAKVGVAYAGPIAFTIGDGAADFVVGDTFTFPVSAGSGKAKIVDADNVDGSQYIEAILAEGIDATAADVEAAVFLTGEFNEAALVFGGNDTADTHRANARNKGIIFRTNQAA